MKNLPIGTYTFKGIVEHDCLYVDKTEEIYKLLENGNQTKYFFLSRPRRFGKSLLVTTLEELFLGNKELFKDLWIYDKIDFKKYPVIKLTMNDLLYSEGIDGFKISLLDQVNDIYKKYNLKLEVKDHKIAFKNLIRELSKIEKVVILIDEYDKPITEFIEEKETADKMRRVLKEFYETIKANDEYLHFVFLTGVSKFSKISIFSTLNNLTDITIDKRFSKIVGIDEKQLYTYFKDRIKILAKKEDSSEKILKLELKKWYNGYSWDGKNFIYNPHSLLSLFEKNEIENYWFKTGTPTFLIKMIKEHNIDVKKLERSVLSEEDFDSFEVDNMNVYALLFQTGYLTIKEVIKTGFEKEYVLSYPNKEVRDSFLKFILNDFVGKQLDNDLSINEMVRKLKANDLEALRDIFKSIFGTIAVKMQPNTSTTLYDRELYYHTIFYLIFMLIGSKIKAEVSTSNGFIDAVVETSTHIYIFEFKMTNATAGIKQIKDKKYPESYISSNKEIVLVGVSFDSENKNIKEWKNVLYDKKKSNVSSLNKKLKNNLK
ncbi:MAG: AAA family ATPase [Cyanobacteriota bacterium]